MLVGLLGVGVLTSLGLRTAEALDVDPASPGPYNLHRLNGIDFVSRDDGWAVGNWSGKDDGGGGRTIARHWDGATWRTFPTVDPGGHANTLYGVAARSSDDAWAVGYSVATPDDPFRPLIEHWDGAA